jgi:hypothetical protein
MLDRACPGPLSNNASQRHCDARRRGRRRAAGRSMVCCAAASPRVPFGAKSAAKSNCAETARYVGPVVRQGSTIPPCHLLQHRAAVAALQPRCRALLRQACHRSIARACVRTHAPAAPCVLMVHAVKYCSSASIRSTSPWRDGRTCNPRQQQRSAPGCDLQSGDVGFGHAARKDPVVHHRHRVVVPPKWQDLRHTPHLQSNVRLAYTVHPPEEHR